MAKFSMTIDDLTVHSHSPAAHRAFIGQKLDEVRQAIGGGVLTEGDVVETGTVSGVGSRVVVGSWKIEEE